MSDDPRIEPSRLRRSFSAGEFSFRTTDEVTESLDIIGQERAVEALEFGVGIRQSGFHLFALGPTGVGKHDLVERLLSRRAADEAPPHDWCYVHNFEHPNRPRLLRLEAGGGEPFAEDMGALIDDLQASIPAAFESDDYHTRRQAMEEEFHERQEEAFAAVHRRAEEKNITILRTPAGIALAPIRDGEVIPPGEFEDLPDEERQEVEETIESLQEEMQEVMKRVPNWERERREKLQKLNKEVMKFAIAGPLNDLRQQYADDEHILRHIKAVESDIVDHAPLFLQVAHQSRDQGSPGTAQAMGSGEFGGPPALSTPTNGVNQVSPGALFRRYKVNVLVDHADTEGAPVIYEDQPSLDNLSGRVEYMAQFGALVTDFNLIRSGALHRANGGYLILDARKVLLQPFAWEQLKRVLLSEEITIESRQQMMGLANTVSLEPEKIPLSVKVILVGTRRLYYALSSLDPEFAELFKVAADFEHDMPRNGETAADYARYLKKLIDDDELMAFSSAAVARVCEQSSREAGDQHKFSTHAESLRDLLREADYWAQKRNADEVDGEDVDRAVDAKIHRNGRMRDRMYEQIQREILLIDTDGEEVGQINGLSVLQLGQFAFGRPSRITARVRMGKGEVVDIEREVDLGGPIHSKGVLIISGYLGARFAHRYPLSLSASLVFEQSYGGIDGDSASLAELCTLKSALAGAAIRQGVAVTGSINQHGLVQAIGGVNEKIEGFFDICRARGLTGDQGVIIPTANTDHLMLRRDVVAAVEAGDFSVWAVDHVDQAVTLLTGVDAGEADEEGRFPDDSLNGRVQHRLESMARRALELHRDHQKE